MTGYDKNSVFSVSEINTFVKLLLDNSPLIGSVNVRGEISNFVNHRSGHFYFTLKDKESAIKAVMFRSDNIKLKFLPENGMKVIVHGRVSAFVRDGVYQLYADDIQPDGVGALYLAYEQLKARLGAEGLFDEKLKRALPYLPGTIGIITSPTGAAVRDMINVTSRRCPMSKLILFPSLVQGEQAPGQLIEGIRYFGAGRADVIIIGRGGGSIEDLWAFNSEALARAIRACPVPVISAVGHETDFTICDFAADKRAPTPSAAAELAVPDTAELRRNLTATGVHLEVIMSGKVRLLREKLNAFSHKKAMTSPEYYIDDRRMALLNLTNRFDGAENMLLERKRAELKRLASMLSTLDPLKIISRGYSAVFGEDGTLIKCTDQVKTGDRIYFRTTDGKVGAEVTDIDKFVTAGNASDASTDVGRDEAE